VKLSGEEVLHYLNKIDPFFERNCP